MSTAALEKNLDVFRSVLGDLVLSSNVENEGILVLVDPANIRAALTELLDSEQTKFDALPYIAAVDYSPRQPRFELVYELYSISLRHRLRLKTQLEDTASEDDLPGIDSVHDIYLTANWHEREIHDLFGIHFNNHPDLRRILLPEGWDGYPLRKEYPFAGKPVWKLGASVDDGVRSDVNLGLD